MAEGQNIATSSAPGIKIEDPMIQRIKTDDQESTGGPQSAVVETLRVFSKSSTREETEDEDDDDDPSHVTLSQSDEQIRQMDTDGSLNQVVGSQSMLSQELHFCTSQPDACDEADGNDDEEEDGDRFSQFCSQQTDNSITMAQRLGLIPSTQEEELLSALPEKLEAPSPLKSGGTPTPTGSAVNAPPAETAKVLPIKSEDAFLSEGKESVAETPSAKPAALRDTPIRESECFGSLLDAVQKITEQEERQMEIEGMSSKFYALQHAANASEFNPVSTEKRKRTPTPKAEGPNATSKTTKRKASPKLAPPAAKPPASSPTKKARMTPTKKEISSKTKSKKAEQRNAQEIAKRAAALAEQTVSDPEMAKKLLLSMALVRENPRSLPSSWPARGTVVPEGFFWAHYPPLEGVLKKHMAEYYELSTTKCQSAQQQTFNNDLVVVVREVSKQQGWKFHKSFTDKSLRDRIRCYYKTHIQNAKKRLRTMVRNPTKKANARHLCSHLDLIEQHKNETKSQDKQESASASKDGVTDSATATSSSNVEAKSTKSITEPIDEAKLEQARRYIAEEEARIARVKQQKEEQARIKAAEAKLSVKEKIERDAARRKAMMEKTKKETSKKKELAEKVAKEKEAERAALQKTRKEQKEEAERIAREKAVQEWENAKEAERIAREKIERMEAERAANAAKVKEEEERKQPDPAAIIAQVKKEETEVATDPADTKKVKAFTSKKPAFITKKPVRAKFSRVASSPKSSSPSSPLRRSSRISKPVKMEAAASC